MKRISLELNASLNKKLKQYALDHYESPYGKQEDILRDALVEFLNAHGTAHPQVEEIKKNQVAVLQSKHQPAASAPHPQQHASPPTGEPHSAEPHPQLEDPHPSGDPHLPPGHPSPAEPVDQHPSPGAPAAAGASAEPAASNEPRAKRTKKPPKSGDKGGKLG